MAKRQQAEEGKSIKSVVIGLVIVILIAGWGCMASSYEAAQTALLDDIEEVEAPRGRVSGMIMLIRALIIFADTAISQIPNVFSVIGWHLQNRIWLPIVILMLAGCAVLFGFGLKMMEGVADDPYKKHRANRDRSRAETGPPAAKSKRKKSGNKRRRPSER